MPSVRRGRRRKKKTSSSICRYKSSRKIKWNWMKQQSVPHREFVILMDSNTHYALLKYDSTTDTYIQWKILQTKIDFNDSSQCNHISCMTFCNDTIYLHLNNGSIITYHIHLDCWKDHTVPGNTRYFIANTAQTVAKQEIHIIDGIGNQHLKWKSDDIGYQQINQYGQLECNSYLSEYSDANLIHISKQNRLLLFGGYDEQTIGEAVDVIRSYDIDRMRWSELDAFVPEDLYGFGCVLTMDEKYILLFGGKYNRDCYCQEDGTGVEKRIDNETDYIYVIDTEKMVILKSMIRCPMKGEFYACLASDAAISKSIVMGFVRSCWIQRKFKYHLRYPEMEVIDLIQCFYSVEMVHLFSNGSKKGYHWKLNVKDIVNDEKLQHVIGLLSECNVI